jgi:hypothetical protein
MMLIATTTAVALFASVAVAAALPATAAASTPSMPPMIVNVNASPDISASLLARVLAETDAIWRPAGVTFVWKRAAREVVPYSRASETGPYVPATLRLSIGHNRGEMRDERLPLGWIVFDDATLPEQEIYLSYANAQQMMEEARGVVGLVSVMPLQQREWLAGRAMGRALAHELGHYLLASKVHTAHGLMKAAMSATDLFSTYSATFRLDAAQRRIVASRLQGDTIVASR